MCALTINFLFHHLYFYKIILAAEKSKTASVTRSRSDIGVIVSAVTSGCCHGASSTYIRQVDAGGRELHTPSYIHTMPSTPQTKAVTFAKGATRTLLGMSLNTLKNLKHLHTHSYTHFQLLDFLWNKWTALSFLWEIAAEVPVNRIEKYLIYQSVSKVVHVWTHMCTLMWAETEKPPDLHKPHGHWRFPADDSSRWQYCTVCQ